MRRLGEQGRLGRREGEEGVALILALLFIVLLTAIVIDFNYEMRVDSALIENHSTDIEAYMAAKSSIAMSLSVLAADLLFGEEEAAAQDGEVYDSLDEPWANSAPLLSLNDAVVTVQIDDEYGKLNLNALIFEDTGTGEVEFVPLMDALTFLFEYRQLEDIPVDVILDWIDSDDLARPNGAENDYYQGLETPFECKNGPFDSIEELLLLPGITPEIYFGDEDLQQIPLNELLTVHGHPEGRININTAPYEVLEAIFSADGQHPTPSAKADEVLARLQDVGPYTSTDELREEGLLPPLQAEGNKPGEEDPIGPVPPEMLDVASSVFRIHGDGQSGESQVRIEAYAWRDTHGSGAAQLFRIIDWRVIR